MQDKEVPMILTHFPYVHQFENDEFGVTITGKYMFFWVFSEKWHNLMDGYVDYVLLELYRDMMENTDEFSE